MDKGLARLGERMPYEDYEQLMQVLVLPAKLLLEKIAMYEQNLITEDKAVYSGLMKVARKNWLDNVEVIPYKMGEKTVFLVQLNGEEGFGMQMAFIGSTAVAADYMTPVDHGIEITRMLFVELRKQLEDHQLAPVLGEELAKYSFVRNIGLHSNAPENLVKAFVAKETHAEG